MTRRPSVSFARCLVIGGILLASRAVGAQVNAVDAVSDDFPTEYAATPTEHQSPDMNAPTRSECVVFAGDADLDASARTQAVGDGPFRVVVRFLIVRRADGSGGLDEHLLDRFMADLNYGFRDTPFVFVQSPEIVFIDDDELYVDIPTGQVAARLLSTHAKAGVVNHILAPTLIGGPPVTGLNFVSGPRGNVLAYERIGQPHSIVFPPHEMGHVFFLYHPYETGTGVECTSGSNCTTAGDLVCDTPASPAVHGGNTTATGEFFATIPGPCAGDGPYAPLTDLYMEAGWPAGHVLRDRFTDGEVDRMVTTLMNISPDLIGPQRPSFVVDCDGDGIDDVDQILAGTRVDRSRDMVPDVCQTFPRVGDLLVSGMTDDVANRVRFFDGDTGAFRDTLWNGMTWVHQLRMGPDGLVYLVRLTLVQRIDLATGRTVDTLVDGVLDGAGLFVDLLFTQEGDLLVLDNASANIRRYDGLTGDLIGVFSDLRAAGMAAPTYMERGPDGHIYVVGGSTVLQIDGVTGAVIGPFVATGAGGLAAGQGLVFGPDGFLYVSNGGTDEVLRFDGATGAFDRVFVSAGSGGLSNPQSLRFGHDGDLYVASRGSDSVKRFLASTGEFVGDFVSSGDDDLDQPAGLLFVPAPVPRRTDRRVQQLK